jgi:acetyl esterase/lipase
MLVPVSTAREFVHRLSAVSTSPVVYAELPGTQHNFDLFHSLRFHAVTDAIESFVTCVHTRT